MTILYEESRWGIRHYLLITANPLLFLKEDHDGTKN
jgi:hypothetical protein